MAAFTLHEFIHIQCDDKVDILQAKANVLLQALRNKQVISRYSSLLLENITTLQAYLSDLTRIPGVIMSNNNIMVIDASQESMEEAPGEYYKVIPADARKVFVYILISLLAGYSSDEQFSHLPIHANILFGPGSFDLDLSKLKEWEKVYYSNPYHIILFWYYNKYYIYGIHNFYYEFLIKEESIIYSTSVRNINNRVPDRGFILLINYLAEQFTSLDINSYTKINLTFLLDHYPGAQIKKQLLQGNFFNIHSFYPYLLLIDQKITDLKKHLDYARANYVVKLDWKTRRVGINKKYQIVAPTDATVVQKIIWANQGKLMPTGPVFALYHIAKHGLLTTNTNIIDIVLSIENIDENYSGTARWCYNAILLKMGYELTLITKLVVEEKWCTILTGILPTSFITNIFYTKPNDDGLNRKSINKYIYLYYRYLYEKGLISKAVIINRFKIPVYNSFSMDREDHFEDIIMYRYNSAGNIILADLWNIYPVLDDVELMQKWIIDSDYYPNIPYIEYTLLSVDLAAKYNIANIYNRSILLNIIEDLQHEKKDRKLYYRRPEHQLGDGKIIDPAGREITIDWLQAQKLLHDSSMSSEQIIFIGIIYALDLFKRTDEILYTNTYDYNYIIMDNDYERYGDD